MRAISRPMRPGPMIAIVLPGELDAGEAMPLARSLFVQEPADLLRVEEQRGKDELGQRLGVDTAGGGDDKVRIL